MDTDTKYVIVGDIGGTNSRLVLFDVSSDKHLISTVYKNDVKVFSSFTAVVKKFMQDFSKNFDSTLVSACCFAVAGPVFNNRIEVTNLPWKIDGKQLENELKIPKIRLMNDFVAQGYGLLTLKEDEIEVVQQGNVDPNGPKGCVGAGTGLGECYLTWHDGSYVTWGCEGGHTDWASRSSLEDELLVFLRNKFGRVSTERVVSGPGLVNVYDFLTTKYGEQENKTLTNDIRSSHEGAALISKNYTTDALCEKAMDIMMGAYGAEVGNAMLKFYPTGGMYITGGIAPKNKNHILDHTAPFRSGMLDKGRLSKVVQQMHVVVVMAEDIGLRGAHYVAKSMLKVGNPGVVNKPVTELKPVHPSSGFSLVAIGLGFLAVGAGAFLLGMSRKA